MWFRRPHFRQLLTRELRLAGANTAALKDGERLLSAYTLPGGERLWIVTEWDRSVTTLLLPEEN